jgi:hypothetical protein
MLCKTAGHETTSKSSILPSPNPELSATMLTQTSFNPSGEFSSIVLNPNTTIFDSRCTSHIFRDCNVFHTYFANQAMNIATTNCGMLSILARDDVEILLCFNGQKKQVVFKSCLHAPDVAVNLLSQGHLDKDGFFITIGNSKALLFCLTTNPNGHNVWAEAPQVGFLYWPKIEFVLPLSNIPINHLDSVQLSRLNYFDALPDFSAYLHVPLMADLWHAHLGHTGKDCTSVMLSGHYATGIHSTTKTMTSHCESCIISKHPH